VGGGGGVQKAPILTVEKDSPFTNLERGITSHRKKSSHLLKRKEKKITDHSGPMKRKKGKGRNGLAWGIGGSAKY